MEKDTEQEGHEMHTEATQQQSLVEAKSASTSEMGALVQDVKDEITGGKTDGLNEDKIDESKEDKIDESKEDNIDESKEDEMNVSKGDKIHESKEDKTDESKEDKMDASKGDKIDDSKEDKIDESKDDEIDESKEKVKDKSEKVKRDVSKKDKNREPEKDTSTATTSDSEKPRLDPAIVSADSAKQSKDSTSHSCCFLYVKQRSEAALIVRQVRTSPGDTQATLLEHLLMEMASQVLEFSNQLDLFAEILARLRDDCSQLDSFGASTDALFSGTVSHLCCIRARLVKLWMYMFEGELDLDVMEFGRKLVFDMSKLVDEMHEKVERIRLDISDGLQKEEKKKDDSGEDRSSKEDNE